MPYAGQVLKRTFEFKIGKGIQLGDTTNLYKCAHQVIFYRPMGRLSPLLNRCWTPINCSCCPSLLACSTLITNSSCFNERSLLYYGHTSCAASIFCIDFHLNDESCTCQSSHLAPALWLFHSMIIQRLAVYYSEKELGNSDWSVLRPNVVSRWM